MKKLIKEFKEFAVKGNVIDLAVGVVIGGAFSKIVTSMVNDIIMPIVGFFTGGINFSHFAIEIVKETQNKPAITLNLGMFLQNVVDFLIIALSIFIVIKFINKFKKKYEKEELKEMKINEELEILKEIRDVLKNK
ncbi:large-conductance mechanosensitive channel protein MscL [Clostridium senegalense]|uniref:large-conductance mechanosensitive channel protein MscL n=1 Tax=Clostridium senegalense TaxID=1465809 RepID=UPI00028984BE|nr:large-conductance mechanosensitive channel protein MscL [Clostridium senegalense]MBU5228310.1 large-conductance mechanosensitive channel protein MscL [Clostridium senegalense]